MRIALSSRPTCTQPTTSPSCFRPWLTASHRSWTSSRRRARRRHHHPLPRPPWQLEFRSDHFIGPVGARSAYGRGTRPPARAARNLGHRDRGGDPEGDLSHPRLGQAKPAAPHGALPHQLRRLLHVPLAGGLLVADRALASLTRCHWGYFGEESTFHAGLKDFVRERDCRVGGDHGEGDGVGAFRRRIW